MAKRERPARALQDEASRRIQRLDDIVEEGLKVRVPPPAPHARDARGRNWDMRLPGNLRAYERPLRAVIDRLRDEFDLAVAKTDAPGTEEDPFVDLPGAAVSPGVTALPGQGDTPGRDVAPRKPVNPFGPTD